MFNLGSLMFQIENIIEKGGTSSNENHMRAASTHVALAGAMAGRRCARVLLDGTARLITTAVGGP
jgi:hypothetical protein